MTDQPATRELSSGYYIVASVLVIFGFLGLLSIGAPFLTLGVAMFCLAPLAKRRSPAVVPILISIATFWAILFAIGPVTCSETGMRSTDRDSGERTAVQEVVSTSCEGEPNTFLRSLAGGLAVGAGVFMITRKSVTS